MPITEEILVLRETLCKKILQKAKLNKQIESLKSELEEDFAENEELYRQGLKTASGVLYRKPRYELSAAKLAIIEE